MNKVGGKSAITKNIWEYLLDVLSVFEASGVSRRIVLAYTMPYIHAVYPKIIEQKINQINPFGFMTKNDTKDTTPGSNGTLTDTSIVDFFSGMV